MHSCFLGYGHSYTRNKATSSCNTTSGFVGVACINGDSRALLACDGHRARGPGGEIGDGVRCGAGGAQEARDGQCGDGGEGGGQKVGGGLTR